MMRGNDPRLWTPVRYVHKSQRCDFCWNAIPRARPGSTTGTRGTKAYFNAALGIWECLKCREAAHDADAARMAIDMGRCV